MPRLVPVLLVVSLFGVAQAGCARRSGRASPTPVASSAAAAKSSSNKGTGSNSTNTVRDAFRALKKRLGSDTPGTADARKAESAAAAPVTVPSSPGDPKGVGTSGAWSVETRYPLGKADAAAGSTGAPRSGPLLRRARQAVRHASGGTWTPVIALCLLAALVVVFALRRGRTADGQGNLR